MEREIPTNHPARDDGVRPASAGEPPLGELLKRLTTDTGELVRQEISLARAELRQVGATAARDGAKVAAATGLALAGGLALTAFLVIGLGALLDNYWLSALIVGLAFVAIAATLGRSAVADVKQRGLVPQQTIASLKEDASWMKQEAREVKREITRDDVSTR